MTSPRTSATSGSTATSTAAMTKSPIRISRPLARRPEIALAVDVEDSIEAYPGLRATTKDCVRADLLLKRFRRTLTDRRRRDADASIAWRDLAKASLRRGFVAYERPRCGARCAWHLAHAGHLLATASTR